ncbi:serine/threonine-protein kinase [Hyalangium rubrum]|uniref:Serine/threonine-protein kinase n=1 Tax=Hyalangium rubrum TaxID=3103134 RepID=A0ABU5H9T5_9BACT|nr:serine/threonine-protein kinase [Hyalangium sp. s54d21]MDY7230252.1 serine/threonine-protein kinase [Hyalangium sp. s54d21]
MLSPGTLIGDYKLIRHVATGAMSEVYAGRHVANGPLVAVKLLSPELCVDAELVARFRNEAHMLERLRHARIITVFASGVLTEGPPYMVLEWLPMDLHQALSRAAAALPPQRALTVARQLAEALGELHRHGIVHRDLKPSNVLLAEDGSSLWNVKLADLGLAKELADGPQAVTALASSAQHVSTGRGALLGTWDYMAPEQWIQTKGVDSKVDVYALGVLLFQMLTGQLPFIAEQQKDLMYFHLFEDPPLDQLKGLVPADTRALVARMLDKKPSQRPSMREFLDCSTPAQ